MTFGAVLRTHKYTSSVMPCNLSMLAPLIQPYLENLQIREIKAVDVICPGARTLCRVGVHTKVRPGPAPNRRDIDANKAGIGQDYSVQRVELLVYVLNALKVL
jgi:hypothetical protein